MLCTRQSAAHVHLVKAGGRRRDLGPGAGSNNYDLACGCVVEERYLWAGGSAS